MNANYHKWNRKQVGHKTGKTLQSNKRKLPQIDRKWGGHKTGKMGWSNESQLPQIVHGQN